MPELYPMFLEMFQEAGVVPQLRTIPIFSATSIRSWAIPGPGSLHSEATAPFSHFRKRRRLLLNLKKLVVDKNNEDVIY